jgi:hypothetical protein
MSNRFFQSPPEEKLFVRTNLRSIISNKYRPAELAAKGPATCDSDQQFNPFRLPPLPLLAITLIGGQGGIDNCRAGL